MQLLFGVLGEPTPPAIDLFSSLAATTADSNRDITPTLEAAGDVRIGHVARSFASWQDQARDRSFHLDGEIRSIDGRDTSGKGASEGDRAALTELYERHGPAMWERLDGSFVLVVRDGRTFHVGVDVVGTRAIYWWAGGGLLAFHSHLMDLAATVPAALSEDLGAIGGFLECGRYAPSETAYREIRHLGAGQCLTFVGGEVTTREYFGLVSVEPRPSRPQRVVVDELVGLLEASIRRCLANATNPVIPLSGGLDSRYIAAEIVRQRGRGSVPTLTWGEDRSRPHADAEIATILAERLGLENTWHEKPQRHTEETFGRALYLSSGESDCAIHYPDDHVLHAELADSDGFGSMFRGDECFGATRRPLTDRAVLADNGLAPLALDPGYDRFVAGPLIEEMAREQRETLDRTISGLGSRTATARRDEIWYRHGVRRFLGPYNRVKHTSLEVYTPLLDAAVLSWLRGVPDDLRSEKAVFRAALDRRFPELRDIPYATASNLPRWEERARRDPAFARFLETWCEQPGWLDGIGAREAVVTAVREMQTATRPGAVASQGPERISLRQVIKRTWPGQLLREMTVERRFASNIPLYLRLARLAVLHALLAPRPAESRHADARVAAAASGIAS